ncbi:unnamed protein product [Fusarium graminearum]|uniref:Chromosome 3, complete genome n=1 Tax=Gibberella zeae (strain ATCC MYA-4620 / CBS 123657 / FGSC 9075 / NRRL 31084 / PH-1) TaxID=229533 RepID=A0A098E4H5_GIBZE|nr:unnamed protein product [Fusarium graminearum]CZS84107.1 unnamed protein product [Fusarium graminearum]
MADQETEPGKGPVVCGSHWVAIEMTLNIVAFWPPIAFKRNQAHATVDGTK